MARARPDHASTFRQLTLEDWAQMLNATREPDSEPRGRPEPLTVLADALAPRLADELSSRIPTSATPDPSPPHSCSPSISWSPYCRRRNRRRPGSAGSTSAHVAAKSRAA
jgi:hypothetical protein